MKTASCEYITFKALCLLKHRSLWWLICRKDYISSLWKINHSKFLWDSNFNKWLELKKCGSLAYDWLSHFFTDRTSPRCEWWVAVLSPHGALRAYTVFLTAGLSEALWRRNFFSIRYGPHTLQCTLMALSSSETIYWRTLMTTRWSLGDAMTVRCGNGFMG